MVKAKKPSFVFLIKTLCSKNRMEWIRVKLGFTGCFAVDPMGRSGGLALLWRDMGALDIYNYSLRDINATVMDGNVLPLWKLTGFYGHPVCGQRASSWELIRHLKVFSSLPWKYVGDFNEILDQSKKEGAAIRRESQMDGFRSVLEDCLLADLGFQGAPFTWSNHKSDGMFTKERLDRALANQEWCSIFVLAARTSDHAPLYVYEVAGPPDQHSFRRGFKFDDSWTLDEEWLVVLKEAWNDNLPIGEAMESVQRKLSATQLSLSRWSSRKFGQSTKVLKQKTQQLKWEQNRENPNNIDTIKRL